MANVKKCDQCGTIGRIRFTLHEPGTMWHYEKELCSADCVSLVSRQMEVDIIKRERQADTLLGRIGRWLG